MLKLHSLSQYSLHPLSQHQLTQTILLHSHYQSTSKKWLIIEIVLLVPIQMRNRPLATKIERVNVHFKSVAQDFCFRIIEM